MLCDALLVSYGAGRCLCVVRDVGTLGIARLPRESRYAPARYVLE